MTIGGWTNSLGWTKGFSTTGSSTGINSLGSNLTKLFLASGEPPPTTLEFLDRSKVFSSDGTRLETWPNVVWLMRSRLMELKIIEKKISEIHFEKKYIDQISGPWQNYRSRGSLVVTSITSKVLPESSSTWPSATISGKFSNLGLLIGAAAVVVTGGLRVVVKPFCLGPPLELRPAIGLLSTLALELWVWPWDLELSVAIGLWSTLGLTENIRTLTTAVLHKKAGSTYLNLYQKIFGFLTQPAWNLNWTAFEW